MSGVNHELDAVVGGKIGVILAKEISPEDSIRIVLKRMDTGLEIVAVFPDPLPEDQKYILDGMGVEVMERSQKRAAGTIMLMLHELGYGWGPPSPLFSPDYLVQSQRQQA